jgi:hypothetical protein
MDWFMSKHKVNLFIKIGSNSAQNQEERNIKNRKTKPILLGNWVD